ncbi:MAG: HlyD family secretion protein [Bacteroidales bacterium]|nr:HlyD family secretion protein [Bacteroidales bacterium]MBQ7820599.1 HlyD family secretion protein [Bacteroidales bacterium]
MADIDNIELRSEKTRQIIGMVPSGIVRYGTLIIAVIIAVLLAVSYFVPYPENLQADATVEINTDGEINVCAYIPYSYINTIHEGMSAEIEFEGYPSADYEYVSATIFHIDKNVHNINGHNFFKVNLSHKVNNTIQLFEGMNGTANILTSDESILQKILSKK